MHRLVVCLLDMRRTTDRDEAHRYIQAYFYEQRVRLYHDWFSIGGRWSGELEMIKLNPKKLKEFQKAVEKKFGDFYGDDKREQAIKMFKEYFPTECMLYELEGKEQPFWRDSFNNHMCCKNDDVQIVDKLIFKHLLCNPNSNKRISKLDDGCIIKFTKTGRCFILPKGFTKKQAKQVIGKYWVAIIDAHS